MESEHLTSNQRVAGSSPAGGTRENIFLGRGFMTEETLCCYDLKGGLRVVLTKPDTYYNIGANNPKVGTKWECVGTVIEQYSDEVRVLWDNGHDNSYKDFELSMAIEGRFRSIW